MKQIILRPKLSKIGLGDELKNFCIPSGLDGSSEGSILIMA